jgi:uncharacterized membrane protein
MAAKAAMAQGAPNYFTAEAMGFILAALFFNTLTAPVVKMTQNSEGGYDYNKWSDSASLETPSQYRRDSCPSDEVVWRDNAPRRCIYFFAELMKLGVALAWCFKAYRENDREVVKHFNVDRSDFLQYAVPGFVFFAQNNLSFLALQHMNSSAFQLLMNTRIVSVAILAVIMLNKRMHALEWTSIVLLMVGAMQYQLSGCGDDGYKIDTMGLCVMAVIVACAAVWKSTSELGSTGTTSRRWRGIATPSSRSRRWRGAPEI